MRKWLGWIAIAWAVAITGYALLAYGSQPSHPSLDDRVRAVALQLRCPVCQGESVADSPSAISRAMRQEIKTRLQHGQNATQIKTYFVTRYGTWILLAPPSTGVDSLAWIAPPLLLLGGVGLLVTLLLAWRSQGRRARVSPADPYLERVRAELSAEGLGEWG